MATTPRSRSAWLSSARRLDAPRSLKAPVAWRFSSFRITSAPVAADNAALRTDGARSTRPAMRPAAASTSASWNTGSDELHAEDLVGAIPARRRHRNGLAGLLADQRFGQRRGNRQPRQLDVGLIHADDLVGGFLLRLLVQQPDMRAELHVLAGQRRRVDHFGGGDDLLQFLDAAFDEGLTFPRGVVLGVLAEIAMATRFRDRTDHGRAFHGFQVTELFLQPL